MATVAEHRATNIHLADASDMATARDRKNSRDATPALPRLMLAALQVNIRGGRAPEPEVSGRRYLKLPMECIEER